MPCRSDYMEPTEIEIELSKVRSFLAEIDGRPFDHKEAARGYFGGAYGNASKSALDADTAKLCARCKGLHPNVLRSYSLELQIWWRDHQEADRKRDEEERAAAKLKAERKAALAKLTPRERKLLEL